MEFMGRDERAKRVADWERNRASTARVKKAPKVMGFQPGSSQQTGGHSIHGLSPTARDVWVEKQREKNRRRKSGLGSVGRLRKNILGPLSNRTAKRRGAEGPKSVRMLPSASEAPQGRLPNPRKES